MGVFENCCCVFDLQVGSALCAIYSLMTSCVPFMFAVMGFVSSISVQASQYKPKILGYEIMGGESCMAMRIGLAVAVSVLGSHMLSSFLLLWASYKNHRYSMIPYMLCTCVIVIIHLGGTSGALYFLLAMRVPHVPNGPFIMLTLSLVNGVVCLYCLLVVVSRYQDLKDQSKEQRDAVKNMLNQNTKPMISKAEDNDYV